MNAKRHQRWSLLGILIQGVKKHIHIIDCLGRRAAVIPAVHRIVVEFSYIDNPITLTSLSITRPRLLICKFVQLVEELRVDEILRPCLRSCPVDLFLLVQNYLHPLSFWI